MLNSNCFVSNSISRNKKNVRQILGKANMYNRFIENRNVKLKPLYDLLNKDVRFVWTKECDAAFNDLRRYLSEKPILAIFNEDEESAIQLYTDASDQGCGSCSKTETKE